LITRAPILIELIQFGTGSIKNSSAREQSLITLGQISIEFVPKGNRIVRCLIEIDQNLTEIDQNGSNVGRNLTSVDPNLIEVGLDLNRVVRIESSPFPG